jgi:hypothetical protein
MKHKKHFLNGTNKRTSLPKIHFENRFPVLTSLISSFRKKQKYTASDAVYCCSH